MKKILFAFILIFCNLGFPMCASSNQQSRAVVFDFGGVLTLEPDRKAIVDFLCESFRLSDEEFDKVNRLKKQASKSGITDEEFWLAFALEREIDLSLEWPSNFKSVMKNALGANPVMFQMIEELKAKKIPVALLSNIDERLGKLVREFGFYEPFELCLLSYEINVEKPDPRAYQHLIETLGLAPEQIIFIDDLAENIHAAEELGIDAIQFESADQIRQELSLRGLL